MTLNPKPAGPKPEGSCLILGCKIGVILGNGTENGHYYLGFRV